MLICETTHLRLTAYSDSDLWGDLEDYKSTSAYIVFLGDNSMSWQSWKQTGVARSSTKVEYESLVSTASELGWSVNLFKELHIPISVMPILLFDNMSSTRLALHLIQLSWMTHTAIDIHFVYDLAFKDIFLVSYVSTVDQLADLLNKPCTGTLRTVTLKNIC